MADETPSTPSEPSDDATKSETIRITLPPKSEQPAVKRETVRINVPGKPAPPPGVSPKKETTKLPTTGSPGAGAPPPPPSLGADKPFVPPPPAPKPPPSAPGMPPPSVRPLSSVSPPPKPPGLGTRPTVPLKPAAPATPEPVTQKAASPKKETARITLPPEGSKPPLPKATVKMQQTQPLVNRPQSTITTAPVTTGFPASVDADTAVNGMAIAALILSLVALATVYLAFSAAGVS